MKLISNWKSAWRMLSVQISILAGAVLMLEDDLPMIREVLPEGWIKWVLLAIPIARVISQGIPDEVKHAEHGDSR